MKTEEEARIEGEARIKGSGWDKDRGDPQKIFAKSILKWQSDAYFTLKLTDQASSLICICPASSHIYISI